MNVISKNKVQVFTSSKLKSVLEGDNDYNYIYIGSDITLLSGIIINSKKVEVTIDSTYENVRYTYTNKKSLVGADTITEPSTTNYYWIVTDYTLTRANILLVKLIIKIIIIHGEQLAVLMGIQNLGLVL